MRTAFGSGTTLVLNGFWQDITTWGFRVRMVRVQSTPTSVGCSLRFRSCGGRNCSRRATVRLGIDTL